MTRRGLRQTLLYFVLVPAIVVAVAVLGWIALRTTRDIERSRQQTVVDATLSLADERVNALDKYLISQDNVAIAHVDLSRLGSIAQRWIPTAARETPTIRAIVVLDMDHADHEVLAFASRAQARDAAQPGSIQTSDDVFRRLLVARLFPLLNVQGNTEELRHLHHVVDQQSLLISYWQRLHEGRHFLVVAWHDVGRVVHDLMPRLYRDVDRGNSRMNVVDEEGRIVFGPPIKGGQFTVLRPFPTTLYNWRLQLGLTTAEQLDKKVERQRQIEFGIVGFAGIVALAGLAIVVIASVKERRLAALKSDFVANVSHELKTPLSLIRMFGELLMGDRVATDDKRRQYLQIIVGESERLTALIENVLDFAKVERGKAAYEFAIGDVAEVAGRAVDVYRYRAEREGVAVGFRAASSLPPARLDARAIELALINLLDNALKYAREGRRVDVEVESLGPTVTITVSDRGPGIDDDEKERIFERFVRGRRAGDKQVRGSGIGLALVKHIAESHGGSVNVRSPVTPDGSGSAFVVTLPALGGRAAGSPAGTSTSDGPDRVGSDFEPLTGASK